MGGADASCPSHRRCARQTLLRLGGYNRFVLTVNITPNAQKKNSQTPTALWVKLFPRQVRQTHAGESYDSYIRELCTGLTLPRVL